MAIIYKRFGPGEIDALRAELIAASGLDLETLRERMETWQVSPEQAAIFRRLEQLDWLEEGR